MLKYETKVLCDNRRIAFYRHGKKHKKFNPAFVSAAGGMFWYEYGQSHRIGGPSDIFTNGKLGFYIRGKFTDQMER